MTDDFKITDGVLTEYCGSAARVKIPDGVRAVGYNAFYRKKELREIEIPEGVECILDWAFAGCVRLERVFFPPSVKSVGKGAFLGCAALKEAAFSEGLEKIGTGAFKFWKNLSRAYLPRTLKAIGASAFGECDSLLCLYFPLGVERVGKEVLAGGGFKTIFSEAREKPHGWDADFDVSADDGWEIARCCTIWGYCERNGEITYDPKNRE